jgi:hypothetical protein
MVLFWLVVAVVFVCAAAGMPRHAIKAVVAVGFVALAAVGLIG